MLHTNKNTMNCCVRRVGKEGKRGNDGNNGQPGLSGSPGSFGSPGAPGVPGLPGPTTLPTIVNSTFAPNLLTPISVPPNTNFPFTVPLLSPSTFASIFGNGWTLNPGTYRITIYMLLFNETISPGGYVTLVDGTNTPLGEPLNVPQLVPANPGERFGSSLYYDFYLNIPGIIPVNIFLQNRTVNILNIPGPAVNSLSRRGSWIIERVNT